MIAAVVPSASVSEDVDAASAPIGDTTLRWELSGNQLVITNSSTTGAAIPNYTTTSSAPWNSHKSTIASISIGNNVTGIGNYAFYELTAATEVSFPSTLTLIGENAFDGCTSLTTVAFVGTTAGVEIDDYAFSRCSKLTNINLNTPTLSSLGEGVFYDCTSLTSITIPSTITVIPEDLFEGCTNLKIVSMGNVTEIKNHAFSGCSKISMISFPSSLTKTYPSTFAGLQFMSGTTSVDPSDATKINNKTWMGSGTDGKLYVSGLSNEYEITFIAGDGASTSSDKMTTVGGKLPSLPTAVKGTSHFDGWFMQSTGGSVVTTNTTFTENKIVYALWGTAVLVESVSLDFTELTVNMGSTKTLTATVTPSNATDPSVTWSSGTPGVATVDSGVITPVSVGTTIITVTTNDGGKTATCNVTVQNVPVDSVTLNNTSATISAEGTTAEKTITLVPTVLPASANVKTVTWQSSSPSVATVDSNGVVTAVSAGKTIITVTTDVGGKTATCEVTVAAKRVTNITMDAAASMNTGGKLKLTAVITPADADVKTILWSSSDPTIATVDTSGEVKAEKAGQVDITATTVDGNKTATCTVTITDNVLSSTTIIIIVVIVVALIAIGAVFYLKKSGTLGGSGGFGGKKKNGGNGKTGVTPLRPINKP